MRTLLILLLLAALKGWTAFISGPGLLAQTPPPQAQEGFVPVDQLPGEEQLPATPLVAAAYGVAWGAVLIYVWFLWRRLGHVERELAEVARRIDSGAGR